MFPEGIERIKVFLSDKEKKSFPIIFGECLSLLIRKREIPFYYFKHLYRQNIKNIHDYIGTKEAARINSDPDLHKAELTSIMSNKLAFVFFARQHGLKTPELYGYQFGPDYFSDTSLSKLVNTQNMLDYFDHLFRLANTDRIFVKPISDFGGKGCFILDKNKNLASQILQYKTSLLSGRHLFFEVVKQHPEINAIHRHCINTLRIVSYIDESGDLDFVSTYLRFGVDRSPVDNAASGGVYVGVNTETGTLGKVGYKSLYYGGGQFYNHPNSKFKFEGFKIPYLKEAYEMITEYLEYLPDRFVGWDVAITPDGPTIIEANDTPDLHVSDLAASGLLKNNTMKSLVNKYKKR